MAYKLIVNQRNAMILRIKEIWFVTSSYHGEWTETNYENGGYAMTITYPFISYYLNMKYGINAIVRQDIISGDIAIKKDIEIIVSTEDEFIKLSVLL